MDTKDVVDKVVLLIARYWDRLGVYLSKIMFEITNFLWRCDRQTCNYTTWFLYIANKIKEMYLFILCAAKLNYFKFSQNTKKKINLNK